MQIGTTVLLSHRALQTRSAHIRGPFEQRGRDSNVMAHGHLTELSSTSSSGERRRPESESAPTASRGLR